MDTPPIVSPQEWEAARQQLLVKEKELTRARDALAAERRRMPWLAVEKEYEFEGPAGKASLLDLFDGRRQLIVYRAFFEPGVQRLARPCLHRLLHGGRPGRPPRPSERPRHHARVRLARAAGGHRAPEGADGLGDDPWYTITDDFDADFGVDEWHGTNAFIRDGDRVFRTYFINARGDEAMGSTWSYLDMTALGRQEEWEDSPRGLPPDPAVRVVDLARRAARDRSRSSGRCGRDARDVRGRANVRSQNRRSEPRPGNDQRVRNRPLHVHVARRVRRRSERRAWQRPR